MGAKECDIYTDVDGVYTTDPRCVSSAKKLSLVSYDEMLELASMGGAGVASELLNVRRKMVLFYMFVHLFWQMKEHELRS